MPRHKKLAPPKFCVSCGDDFALPHHRLCRACLASLNANLARERRLHHNNKRIQAERQRSAKAERDRQRANPANFTASNKAIAHQLALLEAQGLLPDPRRKDYDEEMHNLSVKSTSAPKRPRMPVQANTAPR